MRANNTSATVSDDETLLTPAEAAKYLKISLSWLAKGRMRGEGPPFVRLGRSIRYLRSSLVDWMKLSQSTPRPDRRC
jgi:excisionase family DNA binding protein